MGLGSLTEEGSYWILIHTGSLTEEGSNCEGSCSFPLAVVIEEKEEPKESVVN